MEEIWKPVVGYEGAYEVSNLGRVRSLDRTRKSAYGSTARIKGKMLKIVKNTTNDYLLARLRKDGKSRHLLVHRLVAMAFVENPNKDFTVVNHKDENKQNNLADNLEWCTQKYNNSYGSARERCTKKRSFEVIQYSLDGKEVTRFKSAREAARMLQKSQAPISKCCVGNKRYNSAYGYKWKYAKDVNPFS